MLQTLKFKWLPLSGVITYTHQETLSLLISQAGTTHIELVGGTESNIILCCCMTPFPMEIKMLFRKSYSTGRGNWVSEGILISQMRKQEVRRGRHLLKVSQ